MSDGFTYKRFVDLDTGEILTGREIYKAVSDEINPQSRFEWLKLYPRLIPVLQKIVGSSKFDIFAYIIGKLNYGTNEFTSSKSEIADATGAGTTTVARFFDGLQTYDLVRRVRKSTWMLNPRLLHGGGRHMTNALIVKYGKLQKSDKAEERERADAESETSELFRELRALTREGEADDEN